MRKRKNSEERGKNKCIQISNFQRRFWSLMETRLSRTTRAGILAPSANASDSAALTHRKALGSRLQEGGVVAVIFSISFLDPLS